MYVLWRIIVKEFLQLRQDRRMIPIIFVAPVVQLVIFGFAVNTDVNRVPTVLVDEDRTAASRALVDRFTSSGYFELVGVEEAAKDMVREKEIGTMEQVIVTPIQSWQLIVGKLFPFAVIGFIQIFLVTAVAVWGFGVPLRGSFPLLVALSMLFILNTLGLGLLVS